MGSSSYAQVIEAWSGTWDGPTHRNDWTWDIAVDAEGNAHVTGMSEWAEGDQDYVTFKYDTFGNIAWGMRYDGPAIGEDAARGIALDDDGNVYVTGSSEGIGTGGDYATVKYGPEGGQLWVARYEGPVVATGDGAFDIAVDGAGNAYVTGMSWGTYWTDFATVKYNTNGVEMWVARYDGTANGIDAANAIAVDQSGNVYVTGYSDGVGSFNDFVTIKYNSSGTQQWAMRYNGPGNSWDSPEDIAVDGAGNVYVTGRSEGAGTGFDYATIKYSPSGTQLWVARYNGLTSRPDQAWALGLDAAGNVYVTGYSDWNYPDVDFITVKYDNNGNEKWWARYDGPAVGYDVAYDLAVDQAGNILVTGHDTNTDGNVDVATVKYDPNGNQLWVARHDEGVYHGDVGTAIGVDPGGNVYVTGTTYGLDSNTNDYLTLKYISALDVRLYPDATVVPRGGTLRMTASVTNNTDIPQSVTFWTNITLPNGNTWPADGTLFGPITGTIPAFQTREARLQHPVPNNAPLLTYTYNAFVGPEYLWTWDRDAFRCTVVAIEEVPEDSNPAP
jgi:uncharacterized delta-60 repeat protein